MAYKKAEVSKEITDFLKSDRTNVSFTPEYKQNHFFHIISKSVNRLDIENLAKEQADIVSETLRSSNQTKFTIYFTKDFDLEYLKTMFFSLKPELKRMYENGRLEFKLAEKPIKIWAQDVGQSVRTKDGKSELIKGIRTSGFQTPPMEIPITQIPILFEGGDVTTTVVNGKKTVVIGPQSVNNTRIHYKRLGYDISDTEIKSILTHAFNADNVVMLGSEGGRYDKPHYIFHIDQAVFFPKNNVAVIIDPDSIKEQGISNGLKIYAEQLEKEGFKLIKIPSKDDFVKKYRSYANVIPIELPDGRTKVILPSFGNETLEDKIKKILEDNDMAVVFVKDICYNAQGNIHCITGAIARIDDSYKNVPIKIG